MNNARQDSSRANNVKAFIRDNLMIVLSIALPVIVVVLFAAASVLPRLYTDPPAHNLVLALDTHGIGNTRIPVRIDLGVADGRLRAEVYQLDDGERSLNRGFGFMPRLFEYVAATDTVREIPLVLPEDVTELPDGTEIPIPELADARFVTTLRAPDGYELELDRGGGGLFREIFGPGGRGVQPRIRKGGAVVEIDLPAENAWYYGGLRFIGWVAGEPG